MSKIQHTYIIIALTLLALHTYAQFSIKNKLSWIAQEIYELKYETASIEEIADYLDKKCAEIDTLIEKKTALLEEMETYKKSVIYEYVTGKKEVL